MEMDFHSPAGDPGYGAICLRRGRNRDAPVELAAAAAVRLAPTQLLASAWTSSPMPDPLRRIWRPPFQSPPLPSSHKRAMHDAGRTRTLPATHARTLRLRSVCE